MDEIIDTKLIWHDSEKKKPKIDEQVLIRIETYYQKELRGRGFRIGYWKRDPDGYEYWFYLQRGKGGPNAMGYIFKGTYWAYLPEVIHINDMDGKINDRFEILDIRDKYECSVV